VINCSFLAASLVPHLVATSTAVTNLSTLRLQIERKPPIDVRDPSGTKLDSATLSPSFELQNVTFAYPSRPSNKALDDVSVTMEAGKFTAFVGPSGSGKSTAASLLLRLYDPATSTDVSEVDREIMAKIKEANGEKKEKKGEQEEKEQTAAGSAISGSGTVRFAGHDIQTLNLKWLRSQVAVVLQNPQLISGTVFDNVAVGLTGTDLEYRSDIDNGPNPSPEDKERMQRISQKVEEALKKAQAWDLVCALPDGLETKVTGGRTGVLSGGQVQRVALARALVREPKCLLLDEATSAVSADTEQKIQEALLEEQRQRGMTLIVIAHRLSTIVAADRIFVMVAGRAVHSGTYDELLQPDCPDQTFRSMALVKHTEMPSSPASSSRYESSTSLALSPSTPKVPTPEVPHQVTIPPRMLKTSKAFLNVKYYLIVGFFVGLAGGASFAIAAWLHGRAVNGLRIPDIPLMRATSNRWALWYLVLAIVTFFVYLIFVYGFEYGGEHIVGELRRESVRALIRQDIAFFESGDTGTGGLTAAATTHPSNVGNVVGLISAQAVSSIANLLAVTIMSFVLSWRLAVMVFPALGVTMLLGRFNFDCLHKFEKDIDVENSRQADFVGESANSVQMIAALTREAETMRQFKLQFTAKPTRRRWLFYGSVAMGGSQGMLQLFAALMFHWGSKQLAEGRAVRR
jgi:ATP-binding cassette subfamily B (MDR/TAP) protein 1